MKVTKLRRALRGIQLALTFATVIFFIMLFTTTAVILFNTILHKTGIYNIETGESPLYTFAIICIIFGTLIAFSFSRIPLKPIRKVIAAIDKLAAGDFSARINLHGFYEIQCLNKSFNNMAEELGSVEVLRKDFINNFSHEFKTPIVSISGFAKVLKRNDLTEEERNEYLDIIINESDRLTELASNVLLLSKIENQLILSDVTRFNITEQLRRTITLLENQWDEKNIEIIFDADELYYKGNQEMLNQVWINLIDNAIKFSPENSHISIIVKQTENNTIISISDEGIGLSDQELKHIFDRFYQADLSHTVKGNGLGLSLAKKIIELHDGTIIASNGNEIGTIFVVYLPVN